MQHSFGINIAEVGINIAEVVYTLIYCSHIQELRNSMNSCMYVGVNKSVQRNT